MKTRVLQKKGELLLISHKGRVQTVLNNPYNVLKYESFDGNRIFYKFADDISLQETFDDGIFNCTVKGDTMQLRCSNEIAEAVMEHRNTGSNEKFRKVFGKAFAQKYQDDIIDNFIEPLLQSRRIQKITLGYQIDNRFCVDKHGNAYHWGATTDGSVKRDGWKKLCVSAKGIPPHMTIETPIGKIDLDGLVLDIFSKIYGLLEPNINDKVLIEQLDPDVQEQLRRDAGITEENNTDKETD